MMKMAAVHPPLEDLTLSSLEEELFLGALVLTMVDKLLLLLLALEQFMNGEAGEYI